MARISWFSIAFIASPNGTVATTLASRFRTTNTDSVPLPHTETQREPTHQCDCQLIRMPVAKWWPVIESAISSLAIRHLERQFDVCSKNKPVYHMPITRYRNGFSPDRAFFSASLETQ
uniref:Putative secreted protein n=1 Tax=Anopheles marajoara TaxID=58244 RepID=A0A2M4C7H7_9DIPT